MINNGAMHALTRLLMMMMMLMLLLTDRPHQTECAIFVYARTPRRSNDDELKRRLRLLNVRHVPPRRNNKRGSRHLLLLLRCTNDCMRQFCFAACHANIVKRWPLIVGSFTMSNISSIFSHCIIDFSRTVENRDYLLCRLCYM